MKDNTEQLVNVLTDFIKLSEKTECPNCKKLTKMIGEVRKNGNWWCPFCTTWFPYRDLNLAVDVPFVKLTDQLNTETKPLGAPLGVPDVDFPMDLSTGFLVPSYGSKTRRKRNVLLGQAIDFTRYGRIKSGSIWQFDWTWNNRSRQEYDTLISFSAEMGYHLAFNLINPFRNTVHICYFDSEVEGDEQEFDTISFSVRLSE
jgi:hypothetical protein